MGQGINDKCPMHLHVPQVHGWVGHTTDRCIKRFEALDTFWTTEEEESNTSLIDNVYNYLKEGVYQKAAMLSKKRVIR